MGRGVGKGKGTKGKGKIPPYPLLQSLDRRRPLLQLCAFSLFPFPYPKGFAPYLCYFANSLSIALISSGEDGWILLLNLATTSPCLFTKNFSKFQATSPVG